MPYRDLSHAEQQNVLGTLRALRARFGNWLTVERALPISHSQRVEMTEGRTEVSTTIAFRIAKLLEVAPRHAPGPRSAQADVPALREGDRLARPVTKWTKVHSFCYPRYMNERGHYGNGPAHTSMAYVGYAPPKPPDSSGTGAGTFVVGALLVGGAVLGLRWAFRTMKEDEREIQRETRRARAQQELLDMPEREFGERVRESGLRTGMSQAEHGRALDAYIAKKGR